MKICKHDRKFPKQAMSGMTAFRELVSGQGGVGLIALATSEFDLKEAVKKYRFAILPKVSVPKRNSIYSYMPRENGRQA